MKEEYKIFDKGFNRVLDLMSDADPSLAEIYAKSVRSIPRVVKDMTARCVDYQTTNNNYSVECARLVNAIDLDYTNYKNNIRCELNFVKTNDNNIRKNIEFRYEVYLQNIDNEFYLTVTKSFRGVEIYTKQVPISFDELLDCVELEDEYEEAMEIELDFDL